VTPRQQIGIVVDGVLVGTRLSPLPHRAIFQAICVSAASRETATPPFRLTFRTWPQISEVDAVAGRKTLIGCQVQWIKHGAGGLHPATSTRAMSNAQYTSTQEA
jgi:hypothetical protein